MRTLGLGVLFLLAMVGCASEQSEEDFDSDDAALKRSAFSASSCTGDWIKLDEVKRLTSNGSRALPQGTYYERSRTCGSLGCGAWSAPETIGAGEIGVTLGGDVLQLQARWSYVGNSVQNNVHLKVTPEGSELWSHLGWATFVDGPRVSTGEMEDLEAKATPRCMRARGITRSNVNGSTRETEYVFFSRFR